MSKSKYVLKRKNKTTQNTTGKPFKKLLDVQAGYGHAGLLTLIFANVLRDSLGIETNCPTSPMKWSPSFIFFLFSCSVPIHSRWIPLNSFFEILRSQNCSLTNEDIFCLGLSFLIWFLQLVFYIKYLLLAQVQASRLATDHENWNENNSGLEGTAEGEVVSATNRLCGSGEGFQSPQTAVFSSNVRKFS